MKTIKAAIITSSSMINVYVHILWSVTLIGITAPILYVPNSEQQTGIRPRNLLGVGYVVSGISGYQVQCQ